MVVLIAAALAFAGCRGGSNSSKDGADAPTNLTPAATDTVPSGPPAAAATAPSTTSHAACPDARPRAAGDSAETMTSAGIERTYLLHVPPSYDGTRQTPLVINLHGFGSNGRQQAAYSRLPAKADREGFILVSPDGAGEPRRWTYPGLGAVDDIAFIRELLDRLESTLCIDPVWVFVTGMSNGAAFTSFVACAMPDRIIAIAPVAATAFAPACDGARAIPLISFRGTDDRCVPFDGGTSQCGQRLPVRGAEAVLGTWAAHDGCAPEPARQQFRQNVRTVAYSQCRDDTAVILYIIDGGGHTWPGSVTVAGLGETTTQVDATDEMWQFFVAQATIRASRTRE